MNMRCVSARWRRWGAVLGVVGLAASLGLLPSAPAMAKKRAPEQYSPPYAAIVVDVKTGKTLHAVNADAPRIPASITKVMTLYLLFEQLEAGRLRLDTPLRVSAYAAAQAPSKLGLKPGSTISVEDAILAMVTKSANDVAMVVAENIGGSERAFAQMMTRKARALGMNRTTFYNPHGLPSSPSNITTARDLAILGQAIQDRFPRYYSYFQRRSFTFAGRTHANHNRLLGRVDGVDGIKTGFTRASGFNLLTSAKTSTRHIVAVVLGGRSGPHRDQIMASLVENNLPRAYAGARRTAPITDRAPAPKPVSVASAEEVNSTASIPHPARRPEPAGAPLDLTSIRPVVASAAGSAATPSSGQWSTGPQPVPRAGTQVASAAPVAVSAIADLEKKQAAEEPKKQAAEETKDSTPSRSAGWVIQLAATGDEARARDILSEARRKSRDLLSKASPFTEKFVKDGTTYYRARFSGFDPDSAQAACKTLKKRGFSCFATRG